MPSKNVGHACPEALGTHLAGLLESGNCSDVLLVHEGNSSHKIAVHRCILRARLPDGTLLSTLTGGNLPALDETPDRTVVLSQDVNWEALEAWLHGVYSGSMPSMGEEINESLVSKSARNRIGSAIIGCDAVASGASASSDQEIQAVSSSDEMHGHKQCPSGLDELCKDMGDLLGMAPEMSYADIAITFETCNGRQKVVHAHKAVLSARSGYFAALGSLKRDSKEADCNEKASHASLDTVSLSTDMAPLAIAQDVVKFLYTGSASVKPEKIAHLLLLSDQWCLDELRGFVLQQLRSRVCRKFKKPEGSGVKEAAANVIQVLQLCGAALHYGLPDLDNTISELRDDCLLWLSQWGTKCWTLRDFASLPQAAHYEIRDLLLSNLNPESCIPCFMDCNQILATLPAVAWAAPVKSLTNGLRTRLGDYMLENFQQVSQCTSFQKLMSGGWNTETADEINSMLMNRMTPELIIDVVGALNDLESSNAKENSTGSTPLMALDSQARAYALRHLMWIMRSSKYSGMEPNVREKFVASIEKAGIKEKQETTSGDSPAKGGEFFVVFDDEKCARALQSLRRCPLANRAAKLRRKSSSSAEPPMGSSSAVKVLGSKSVDLTGAGSTQRKAKRPSSRASSICSDESSEWNNSMLQAPVPHVSSASWGSEPKASTSETKGLRRKGPKSTKAIPKPPRSNQKPSGLCYFGKSKIPRPPKRN